MTWRAAIATLALGLLVLLSGALNHYKKKDEAAQKEISSLSGELDNAYAALKTQQALQDKLWELDAKYTKELVDAKQENDRIRADITSGKYRVYVKAKCPTMPQTGAASGVADAGGAQLDGAATEHLLILRERADRATIQIKGLQDYIREQCQ